MHKMWKTAEMPQNSGFLTGWTGLPSIKKTGSVFYCPSYRERFMFDCGLPVFSVYKQRETLDGTLRLGWKDDFFIPVILNPAIAHGCTSINPQKKNLKQGFFYSDCFNPHHCEYAPEVRLL